MTKQDTDGDCLDDWEEFKRGTNPANWDTDYDGLSDGPCKPKGAKQHRRRRRRR